MDYNNPNIQQANYGMQPKQINYRKYLILSSIAIVIMIIIWLLSQYSFVQTTVISGAGSGEISYRINGGAEVQEIKSTDKSIKKLVRKGEYEIGAVSGKNSGLSYLSTGGFLTTAKSEIKLQPQKQREFIGNKPRACMYLNNSTLISYACGDDVTQAYVHMPATASTPTYTKPIGSPYVGNIQGQFKIGSKQYISLKASVSVPDQAPHGIYELNSKHLITAGYPLDDLDETEEYTAWPYQTGFIAVNSLMTSGQYYSSVKASPQEIDLTKSENEEAKYPYDLDINGNKILIASGESQQIETDDEDSDEVQKSNTTITIMSGQNFKSYDFDEFFEEIKFCGTDKICTLTSGNMTVYDVSGDKSKRLFGVSGVENFDSNSQQTVIIREGEVINLDVNKGTGSIDYTSSEFITCGISLSESSYLLCIDDNETDQRVVEITSGEPNEIDSHVAELSKLTEVKSVSPYRNFIYISPDLGEYEFNPSSGRFEFDPVTKKRVNTLINSTVKGLDADPKYEFINPLDN